MWTVNAQELLNPSVSFGLQTSHEPDEPVIQYHYVILHTAPSRRKIFDFKFIGTQASESLALGFFQNDFPITASVASGSQIKDY